MRAVVCRVDHATVTVDDQIVGRVERGLLIYVGVLEGDAQADAEWIAEKLLSLRLFNDAAGKMNLSVRDVGGGLLLIPNFTLAGRTHKGTRPSYSDAAPPELARPLFNDVAAHCGLQAPVGTGVFGAHMLIDARFNGPVTVNLDSRGG